MSTADDDWLAAQLREVERGEAAAMTARRNPSWLPWVLGLWVFTGLGGATTLQGDASIVWLLAHQAAFLGYLWWDHHRAPSPRGRMPREYRVYYLVVGLLAAALMTVGLVTAVGVGGWSGAAFMGVAAIAFGLLADRTYDRITRTVKERLA